MVAAEEAYVNPAPRIFSAITVFLERRKIIDCIAAALVQAEAYAVQW